MRPVLKTLYSYIKSNSAIVTKSDYDLHDFGGGLLGQEGHEQHRKFLADKCVKLAKPVAITTNSKCKTSCCSGGSISWKFKRDCNIIGLIYDCSYCAILDTTSCYFTSIDPDGTNCSGIVELRSLDIEILNQIAAQI